MRHLTNEPPRDHPQAYLFARPADVLMHAEKWDEALKLIDSGIKTVDAKAQKEQSAQRGLR